MVLMRWGKPTKDRTLTALQLYEEVKYERAEDLEDDLSEAKPVKSQEMLKQLIPKRGMDRFVKHKATEPEKPRSVPQLVGKRVHVVEDTLDGSASTSKQFTYQASRCSCPEGQSIGGWCESNGGLW